MTTIIFDVDDTLYDQALSFHETFKQLINDTYSYDQIDRIYRASRNYSETLFDQSERGEITVLDWQVGRYKLALQDFGIDIDDDPALEFHKQYKRAQGKITLFPEVETLLDYLKTKDVTLAILTNGEVAHQSMKIDQLQLEKWIPKENTFISGTYGIAKPNPEIFHIIENKLPTQPASTIYVGDSFEKDIIGAKQAGWEAVWMNHRLRQANPMSPYTADKEIISAEALYHYFTQRFN
ncbi:putative hydrolase of the HAD superfamily [Halolactibacillus halophilus]|uniref:Hydrolase n=1 Tax=Halolactibacillus halophilus TaxID=306540 RepID=A0A1I5NL94_9BACI|nr:HAD family hydrolase [Halolactibacillus halophilus]GEM01364.1 hydrolase [Halolactibacillus halophilus]SFP22487.1 putative hydrolase of the HAD superfamily [Halolactibacillus halophilus]